MSTFDLFVYGTLQSGGAATALLDGCERIADAVVDGILYDIDGRFPALVLYPDSGSVHGEVWRCPASLLLRLDDYEGTTHGLFRRVATEAHTSAGPLACWTYVAGPALSRKLSLDRRIHTGSWPHLV